MKTFFLKIVLTLSFAVFQAEAEPLVVLTTLPDLAEVVKSVGGAEVTVDSLLSGKEDPHYLDAVPSFISKASRADVLCFMGFDLEIGWIPKVLSRSANKKIQTGGVGHCEAGKSVTALEKPKAPIDRSMGDVHPHGNPHYNLSPKALGEAALTIADILAKVRPEKAKEFQERALQFKKEMNLLHERVLKKIKLAIEASNGSLVLIEYHKEFGYFFDAYQLKSLGSIEEKPGVPPSAAQLAAVAKEAQSQGVRLALAGPYVPEKHLKKFTEISKVPYKKLPTMVQKDNSDLNSLEKVQHFLADTIVSSLN